MPLLVSTVWHPGGVDPWTLGLVVVVVVGLAVILYGALADRARNKRRAAEMLAPPSRPIPHFRPDAPAPAYLSELQARRPPEDAAPTELSVTARAQLEAELDDRATVKIGAGYLSDDFVTDPSSGWAVLELPRVLVCTEPVASTRELLGVLERFLLGRTPLVVAAPEFAPEVRQTLQVNQIQQLLRLVAVAVPDRADLDRVALATGAQPKSSGDLQAGYVWPEHLGGCVRWVSTAKASFVVGPDGAESGSGPT